MSNTANEITRLFNMPSAAAPDITSSLKNIGNGEMLGGVKAIFNYALIEGEKRGMVKGSALALGLFGAVYLIPKGIGHLKKKRAMISANNELGEKIHNAFSTAPANDEHKECTSDKEISVTSDEG